MQRSPSTLVHRRAAIALACLTLAAPVLAQPPSPFPRQALGFRFGETPGAVRDVRCAGSGGAPYHDDACLGVELAGRSGDVIYGFCNGRLCALTWRAEISYGEMARISELVGPVLAELESRHGTATLSAVDTEPCVITPACPSDTIARGDWSCPIATGTPVTYRFAAGEGEIALRVSARDDALTFELHYSTPSDVARRAEARRME